MNQRGSLGISNNDYEPGQLYQSRVKQQQKPKNSGYQSEYSSGYNTGRGSEYDPANSARGPQSHQQFQKKDLKQVLNGGGGN